MNTPIYPYKTIHAGKYTKYIVSIATTNEVIVEHYFRGKRKSQLTFSNQNEIKLSELPKGIKQVALWAQYESKALIINVESDDNKWF
jgi:hypothetical protein